MRPNPFDFVPLATPHFAILWHHKKHNLQKFLLTKKRDYDLVAMSSLMQTNLKIWLLLLEFVNLGYQY